LRNKQEKQWQRFEFIEKMGKEAQIAEREREWEEIVVEKVLDEVEGEKREWLEKEGRDWATLDRGWSREFLNAGREAKGFRKVEIGRAAEQGERMVEIFEEEKVLWKKERDERRRKKTGRWPKGKGPDGSQAEGKDEGLSTTKKHIPPIETAESAETVERPSAEKLVSFRRM